MRKEGTITTQSQPGRRRPAWLRPLVRFFAWWFSFFALLGPLSTCPICGQPGCAGGIRQVWMVVHGELSKVNANG